MCYKLTAGGWLVSQASLFELAPLSTPQRLVLGAGRKPSSAPLCAAALVPDYFSATKSHLHALNSPGNLFFSEVANQTNHAFARKLTHEPQDDDTTLLEPPTFVYSWRRTIRIKHARSSRYRSSSFNPRHGRRQSTETDVYGSSNGRPGRMHRKAIQQGATGRLGHRGNMRKDQRAVDERKQCGAYRGASDCGWRYTWTIL